MIVLAIYIITKIVLLMHKFQQKNEIIKHYPFKPKNLQDNGAKTEFYSTNW